MTWHNFLYSLDEDAWAEPHIDHAARLARGFEGALLGVSSLHLPPWPKDGAVALLRGDPLDADWRAAQQSALVRETVFRTRLELAGLSPCSIVRDDGGLAAAVCTQALYADLVIMVQPDPATAGYTQRRRGADSVLQNCPRPVLVLPFAGAFEPLRGPALVAWDGSAGAARAAAAALPWLRRASRVHLVRVCDPRKEAGDVLGRGMERAAGWLSSHGLEVQATVCVSELGAGETLLSEGAARGIQLMVMGAWGHRRVVERLLGGATRTLVDCMTAPVLFSH